MSDLLRLILFTIFLYIVSGVIIEGEYHTWIGFIFLIGAILSTIAVIIQIWQDK